MLGHHHHHHDDHDDHDDHGHHGASPRRLGAVAAAGLIVMVAILSASLLVVQPGQAIVVSAFGNPIRILTTPGLAWRLPAPLQNAIPVDLRLRTTSSGLQDVGTKDGLRVLMQAFVAWQVAPDPDHIRQYLRAVRNNPDEAADQLRSFLASSLEISAARFALAQLVNTDPSRVDIAGLEQALAERIDAQSLRTYGITIRQVGIERLTLPAETLAATVARMTAERTTVAAQRTAEGERAAAAIRSQADRDARILVADAKIDAAKLEAAARVTAATTYGAAYAANPELYTLLRSLDTLDSVIGDNTRLILRTDAAPFRAFVESPGPVATPPKSAAKPGGRP